MKSILVPLVEEKIAGPRALLHRSHTLKTINPLPQLYLENNASIKDLLRSWIPSVFTLNMTLLNSYLSRCRCALSTTGLDVVGLKF
jgi:hypothetical protein